MSSLDRDSMLMEQQGRHQTPLHPHDNANRQEHDRKGYSVLMESVANHDSSPSKKDGPFSPFSSKRRHRSGIPSSADKQVVSSAPTISTASNSSNNSSPTTLFPQEDECLSLIPCRKVSIVVRVLSFGKEPLCLFPPISSSATEQDISDLLQQVHSSKELILVNPSAFGTQIPARLTMETCQLVAQVARIESEDWARLYKFHQVQWPNSYETEMAQAMAHDATKRHCSTVCFGLGSDKTNTIFGRVVVSKRQRISSVYSARRSSRLDTNMSLQQLSSKFGMLGQVLYFVWKCARPVTLSLLEIVYEDQLRDLLATKYDPHLDKTRSPCRLRHVDKRGAIVTNLSSVELHDFAQLETLLQRAFYSNSAIRAQRREGSRGHVICTVKVWDKHPPTNLVDDASCATVTLVDLAGGESDKDEQSSHNGLYLEKKRRSSRIASVRKSLSVLRGVLRGLLLQEAAAAETTSRPIPWRECTLTKVLQRTLDSPTSRAICVSSVCPQSSSYEKTLSTLDYTSRLVMKIGETAKSPFRQLEQNDRMDAPPMSSPLLQFSNKALLKSVTSDPRQRLAKLMSLSPSRRKSLVDEFHQEETGLSSSRDYMDIDPYIMQKILAGPKTRQEQVEAEEPTKNATSPNKNSSSVPLPSVFPRDPQAKRGNDPPPAVTPGAAAEYASLHSPEPVLYSPSSPRDALGNIDKALDSSPPVDNKGAPAVSESDESAAVFPNASTISRLDHQEEDHVTFFPVVQPGAVGTTRFQMSSPQSSVKGDGEEAPAAVNYEVQHVETITITEEEHSEEHVTKNSSPNQEERRSVGSIQSPFAHILQESEDFGDKYEMPTASDQYGIENYNDAQGTETSASSLCDSVEEDELFKPSGESRSQYNQLDRDGSSSYKLDATNPLEITDGHETCNINDTGEIGCEAAEGRRDTKPPSEYGIPPEVAGGTGDVSQEMEVEPASWDNASNENEEDPFVITDENYHADIHSSPEPLTETRRYSHDYNQDGSPFQDSSGEQGDETLVREDTQEQTSTQYYLPPELENRRGSFAFDANNTIETHNDAAEAPHTEERNSQDVSGTIYDLPTELLGTSRNSIGETISAARNDVPSKMGRDSEYSDHAEEVIPGQMDRQGQDSVEYIDVPEELQNEMQRFSQESELDLRDETDMTHETNRVFHDEAPESRADIIEVVSFLHTVVDEAERVHNGFYESSVESFGKLRESHLSYQQLLKQATRSLETLLESHRSNEQLLRQATSDKEAAEQELHLTREQLSQQNQRHKDESLRYQQEISQLEARHGQLMEDKLAIEKIADEAITAHDKLEQEISRLNEQLESRDQETSELVSNYNDVVSTRNSLKQELRELSDVCETLHMEKENFEFTIAQLREKIRQLESENARLTEEAQHHKHQMESISQEARLQDEAELRLEALNDEVERLKLDNDDLCAALAAEQDGRAAKGLEMESGVKQIQREATSLRHELHTSRQDFEEESSSLRHAIATLEDERSNLLSELSEARRSLKESQAHKQVVGEGSQKMLDNLEQERNQLVVEITRLENEKQLDKDEIKRLRQSCEVLQQQNTPVERVKLERDSRTALLEKAMEENFVYKDLNARLQETVDRLGQERHPEPRTVSFGATPVQSARRQGSDLGETSRERDFAHVGVSPSDSRLGRLSLDADLQRENELLRSLVSRESTRHSSLDHPYYSHERDLVALDSVPLERYRMEQALRRQAEELTAVMASRAKDNLEVRNGEIAKLKLKLSSVMDEKETEIYRLRSKLLQVEKHQYTVGNKQERRHSHAHVDR